MVDDKLRGFVGGTLAKLKTVAIVGLMAVQFAAPEMVVNASEVSNVDNTENVVNIADYGVKYNNPNAPINSALEKAQADLVKQGGGTIYFPDNKGILYMNGNFRLKSNISIDGDESRSTIRVSPKDDGKFYSMFLIEHVDNVSITDMELDTNYYGGARWDISKNPQMVLTMANAHNVDVSDNQITGSGIWLFAAHAGATTKPSSEVSLNDNDFKWVAGKSTKHPGPVGVDVDNTAVYWDAENYEMRNNTIKTNTPIKTMTAIEQHGKNGVVADNRVDNYRTGLIIWSEVADNYKAGANNHVTTGNVFNNVNNGISVNSSPGRDLNGVLIDNNKIVMNPRFYYGSRQSKGIELRSQTGQGQSNKTKNVKVTNNEISSLQGGRNYGIGTSWNYYGIGFEGGKLDNVEVSNNNLHDLDSIGVILQDYSGTPLDVTNSKIENNRIATFGKSRTISVDKHNYFGGIIANNRGNTRLNNTVIRKNTIVDNAKVSSHTVPLRSNLPTSQVYAN